MKKVVYDVEVSPNRSMVGFMDIDTKKISQFQHDESDAIVKYINGVQLISFNGLNYDNIILTEMIDGKNAEDIYKVSVDLIELDGKRWHYNSKIKNDIDLIEVSPGQASLKLYGARLGVKMLQDLPYDPHKKHSKKMWKNVCEYNVNDLILTEALYVSLLPQLKIREDIGKQYGIDVMSKSDAQIAESVFKKVLGIMKKPKIDRPKEVIYKAPGYIKFKNKNLKKLLKKFESTVYLINPKTGKFVPQDWLKEKVVIGGITYTIGYGGLHSNEKSISIGGDIKNADISSMYPSLIINSGKYPTVLGEEWSNIYKKFRDDRMEIKHTDKTLSALLKIFLNGSYGKLNSVYSILYAPHLMLDTTITGQLSLLMVIEALNDAKIKVISANTDGVEYIDSTNRGEKIIDKLGIKMNLGWEHASYLYLHARDVNNYVAVYDGYVKSKGAYSGYSLSKNPQTPIVYEAIRKFLLNGTEMVQTINNCKNISQFCTSRAVTGGAVWSNETYPNTEEYELYLKKEPFKQNKALEKRNENYQKAFVLAKADEHYVGKTVRFYYSKKGHKMFYKKSGNSVPNTEGCRPMMKLKKKVPKDLDYGAYVALANKYLKDLGYEK